MKRLFTTLLILLGASYYPFAQVTYVSGGNRAAQKPPKIIDASVMQVVYQVSSVGDSLAPDRVAQDDMILQIGKNRISKYYPDTRVQDSIMQERIGRQMAAAQAGGGNVSIQVVGVGAVPNGSGGAGGPAGGPTGSGNQTIIFKNWPTGTITVTDRVMRDAYSYTESMNEMQWQILPDTQTILSYSCQKATTTFRGRDYEAWFTPDIPLNEGPWKFCGLPGLILKVSDTRQHYVFECIGLEQVEKPIEYADVDYLKTNRKELSRVKRKFYEDPIGAMEQMSGAAPAGAVRVMRAVNADGTTVDEGELRNRMRNRAYNPIELDF